MNLYKKFRKKIKNRLAKELKPLGYKYIEKEDTFVGFYDDLVFQILFGKHGYGSYITVIPLVFMPIIQRKLINFTADYPSSLGFPNEISDYSWSIERDDTLNSKQIEEKLNKYINDIEFIIKNYLFYINSVVVITFNNEKYIKDEYEYEYGEFLLQNDDISGYDEYLLEFLDSDKEEEDWTDLDTQKAKKMEIEKREKEFPFLKYKKEITKNIEQNRASYNMTVKQHLKEGFEYIVIDNCIKTTRIKKFLFDSSIGKMIVRTLNKLGLEYVLYDSYADVEIAIFKYNSILTKEIKVILKNGLFIEFEILDGDIEEKVAIYNSDIFSFGWLIGNELKCEKNVNNAIKALNNHLAKKDNYRCQTQFS